MTYILRFLPGVEEDNLLKAMIDFEIAENCTPMDGKIKQATSGNTKTGF